MSGQFSSRRSTNMSLSVVSIFSAVLAVACAVPQYYSSPLYAQAPLAVAHAPVAVAHAPVAIAHAPVSTVAVKTAKSEEAYDPNPQYNFNYEVNDLETGDQKSQTESRDGDVVQGSYSLIEPDGTKRTVEYTADPVNGFNAVVRREPGAAPAIVTKIAPKPVLAKPIAPVVQVARYAPAPLISAKIAAPLTVAHAPVAFSHAPVAISHAPALYTSSFSSPYINYHL